MISQGIARWGLADTGCSRYLISKRLSDSLPLKIRLIPPGSTVLAEIRKSVNPKGWGILKFEIGNKIFYHEVRRVKELPVDFAIGADLMIPDQLNCVIQTWAAILFILNVYHAMFAMSIWDW